MSTANIDLDKLVRRIVLDVSLLRWFAVNGRRDLAVISAIVNERRQCTVFEGDILDFLERFVGDGQPDDSPPPDAA